MEILCASDQISIGHELQPTVGIPSVPLLTYTNERTWPILTDMWESFIDELI